MGCFSTPPQGSTSVTADFLKQHGVSIHTCFLNASQRLPIMLFLGLNTSNDFFYRSKIYLQAPGVGDTGYEMDMIFSETTL